MAPIEYDKCGRMKFNPELHQNNGKPWSDEDLEYLINWYEKIGLEEMSLAVGRSEVTVAAKVGYLRKRGIMKKGPRSKKYNNKLLKKATKNPDQSILSSKTKNILKNSTPLYHMEGGNQVAN